MPVGFLIVAAAAASASGAATTLPDIAVTARVRAREVRVEQGGTGRIHVWAEPPASEKVDVKRNLPKGQRSYRNLDIQLEAEARLSAPEDRRPSPSGE